MMTKKLDEMINSGREAQDLVDSMKSIRQTILATREYLSNRGSSGINDDIFPIIQSRLTDAWREVDNFIPLEKPL